MLVMPILLLRRVPMMRALRPLMRPLRTCTDAFLTGGFGPIGEGALFYATLAERHAGFEEAWTVAGLVVFGSVIAFGVTVLPLTKWYGSYEGPKRGSGSQQDGGSQQSEDLHKNQAARTR